MSKDKEECEVTGADQVEQSVPVPPVVRQLTAEEDVALTQTVARQERDNATTLNAQRRVRIVISSGRDAHEQCPVTVGVNGRAYLIERDKEVEVPESVVHVLQLAVEQTPVLEQNRVVGFRPVPRYPLQVL